MSRIPLLQILVMLLLLLPASGWGEGAQDKDKKLPVEVKLVAKKDAYRLMLGDKTPEEFRKLIKDNEKTGKLPESPNIDLALEVKNISDKDIQLWVKGDPVVLNLEVKGEGAVSVTAQQAFTQEFRIPAATIIKPGATYSYPIKSLKYGFRGAEKQAFWTEPGAYTISATFKTGVSPAPPGTKPDNDGFGPITFSTIPVVVKVTK